MSMQDPNLNAQPLLEMIGIHQSFALESGRRVKALEDVTFSLFPSEILVLIGPSGSGKSTSLRIMAGLMKPSSGRVVVGGEILEGTNGLISMVFQSFALLPWLNVRANVAIGLGGTSLSHAEASPRIEHAIQLVGLSGFEEAYPRELSGGMKQRVGVARALVMERPILCLDEPFSSLDVLSAETLRKEILQLWQARRTSLSSMVLVTHNIQEAVSLGSRILVMGANPGHIRVAIKNDLPYPRDEKSGAFKNLVDNIHDVITEAFIPDTPEWVPPALAGSGVDAIPPVYVNDVVGLLELIHGANGRGDIFQIALKLNREFLHILSLAKAAELLDLVDTPRNNVVLTELGKKFVTSAVVRRKEIVHDQLLTLRIVQLVKDKLDREPERNLSRDEVLDSLREWLPNEDIDQVLTTLIQWGRFGELFSYNDDTRVIESV